MAGHSKWANIQHRKNAQDKKRGKIFTRINRELSVAARQGGGDVDTNPALRLAVDKANAANMPRDNIDRAIKKATGDLEGVSYEQARYEGYGPSGVAVMVDCLTDNKNRTVAEVRHAFSKHNGNLGTDGSVAYLFSNIGVFNFAPGQNEDALMEAALEAGADDIVFADDLSAEVLSSAENFMQVRTQLQAAGLQAENAEVTMRASLEVELDEETARKVLKLLDALEELDDTQDVFSNAAIPDAAYD